MPLKPLALAFLVAGCAVGAAEPDARSEMRQSLAPARPAMPSGSQGEAARALTRTLFEDFHSRIVEAQEHRSGPGAVLTHISLYERPETTHLQGLCEATVHAVGVLFAPPPHDPPRTATWMRTGARYFAIGEVGPSIPPPNQERGCADLPTAQNFFSAPSRETAHAALQTYTDARRWAAARTREATFACKALDGACPAPDMLFGRVLTPDRIVAVDERPCEPGPPGRGTRCFTYQLNTGSGLWSVSIKGPERPIHVRAWQTIPPVS